MIVFRPTLTLGHLGHRASPALAARAASLVLLRRGLATAPTPTTTGSSGSPVASPPPPPPHVVVLHEYHPVPIRPEFLAPVSPSALEALDIGLDRHREPADARDRAALRLVKSMRIPADLFFRKKYIHRAVLLETVAGVPGMVGAVIRHLHSLRRLAHDGGWISHLLHEAENERMHLMTFMKLSKPNLYERLLVTTVQGVFFNAFFFLYLVSPATAHRVVGYLEEEAVISYTSFLKEIDAGRIENVAAPEIAIEYWNLPKDARLREVVLAVRADEATHRDSNHHFADCAKEGKDDLRTVHHIDQAAWRPPVVPASIAASAVVEDPSLKV
ncbi:alternative oxidase-domain-containing protein [Blastocladiella britannica]|nr:alternative oxidase-domain-containing protein [Blastocladiella britannica]